MKKLLILNNSYWNFYNFRILLIKTFSTKFEVVLAAPKDKYCKFMPKNIKQNYFQLKTSGKNFFFEFISIFSIAKIIFKEKPNLIISFTPKINLYVSIISLFLKKRNISVFTGLGNFFLTDGFLRYLIINLFKFFLKKNILIIFQNHHDLNFFVKNKIINKKKVKLIEGSGVELKKFKYKQINNNRVLNFLYIGRIIEDKGIKDLLEAITFLKRKNFLFNFTIVGKVDCLRLFKSTHELFLDCKKKKYFDYFEHTDNPSFFINKSDYLILPSYREGFPKTILEAFSIGRIVLASNVPGCNNIIKHKINGLLFKARDYKSIAKTMICAIKLSDKNKKKIIKNNLELIKKSYQSKIIVNRYMELIS